MNDLFGFRRKCGIRRDERVEVLFRHATALWKPRWVLIHRHLLIARAIIARAHLTRGMDRLHFPDRECN